VGDALGDEPLTFNEQVVGARTWSIYEPPHEQARWLIYAFMREGDVVYGIELGGHFPDPEAARRLIFLPMLEGFATGDAAVRVQPIIAASDDDRITMRSAIPRGWVPVPDYPNAYGRADGQVFLYFTILPEHPILARLAQDITGLETPEISYEVIRGQAWAFFSTMEQGQSSVYAIAQDRENTYIVNLYGALTNPVEQIAYYLEPSLYAFAVVTQ
jgi:hypothetical protein